MANTLFIQRFLERPRSHKIAFWVLTLGVILFLFWQYFYSPQVEQLATAEKENESLKAQVVAEERIVKSLPQFKEEVNSLIRLRELALNQLPLKKEMDELLSSITALARESGLDVKRFAPGEEVLKDYYAEVPIDLSFESSFPQLMTFFDEISRLSRIVSVSAINLKNPRGYQEESDVSVDGSCRLITYRHLEESERVVKETADIDQSKRGKGGKNKQAAAKGKGKK